MLVLVAITLAPRVDAQQKAEGFGVERLSTSAPGGGWFVMDTLDMHGGLGGAMALTTGYARNPLRVTDGGQRLAVVSDQAFADFSAAATYDRWRLYLNLNTPLVVHGQSGTVGNYQFTAPGVDPASNPDILSDARIGLDVRLHGEATSPSRVGVGVQLFVPNGNRGDYHTDGSYRAIGRLLFAGDDSEIFTYAGHLGVHIRPLDDSPTPGSPQGSEFLFGLALGRKFPLYDWHDTTFIIGPEFYGATAFRSFFGADAVALEGLLTGRLEGTADDGPQVRIKLGAGGGFSRHLGAPEWRLVFAIEVFDHHTDRDKDGISDSKDACPDVPGILTKDPKTNGCPPDRDSDGVPPIPKPKVAN